MNDTPATIVTPSKEAIGEAVRRMEQECAEAMARYPKPTPRHCPTCRCFEQP